MKNSKNKKSISTLVQDIQDRVSRKEKIPEDQINEFAADLARSISSRLSEPDPEPSLRLSNLGWPDRKLWYAVNRPALAEPLSASTRIKFLYGDILESLVLFLAKLSGHDVRNQQDEVSLSGVKGHIDAEIDGELVDVKSASSYSFKKFQSGGLVDNDPFGYVAQLGAYRTARDKPRGHFLAVDKTLGHLCLDTHEQDATDYEKLAVQKQEMLKSKEPPERCYPDEEDGRSGNRKLSMPCSYCAWKTSCWENLRAFKYSRGPVFLTKVAREPDVPELDLSNATEE